MLDKVYELNIDTKKRKSGTFTVALQHLNGLLIESVAEDGQPCILPANNLFIDIQRIGLDRKGRTLVNRVPLQFFYLLSSMKLGTLDNGKNMGAYIDLGSLFLTEKDELQIALTYDNSADYKHFKLSNGEVSVVKNTTAGQGSVRLKVSTVSFNNALDYSLRYDKSKDFERPVNMVEGVFLFSDNGETELNDSKFGDMSFQFERTVGDDIICDISTTALATCVFNRIENEDNQKLIELYQNRDLVPSSGRVRIPTANDYKDLTLVIVERVYNSEAVLKQTAKTMKEESERVKSLSNEEPKAVESLKAVGALPDVSETQRAVEAVEGIDKAMHSDK